MRSGFGVVGLGSGAAKFRRCAMLERWGIVESGSDFFFFFFVGGRKKDIGRRERDKGFGL